MNDHDLARWADDGGPVPDEPEAVLVHRIEDEDGYGPFQELPAWGEIDWDAYNENVDDYPSPANDPGFDQAKFWNVFSRRKRLWEVGCCSREQLQHWFDARTAAILSREGYRYTVFRAPADKVFKGAFQAVFDRDAAECIGCEPAAALWSEQPVPLAA